MVGTRTIDMARSVAAQRLLHRRPLVGASELWVRRLGCLNEFFHDRRDQPFGQPLIDFAKRVRPLGLRPALFDE